MYQSTCTQQARQRPSTISLTKCTAYIPVKVWRKRWRQTSISTVLLEKKQLQNFGKIVNQQLHLYKNTFGFSVRARKVAQLTLKTSFFGSWGENMILELSFWNVLCPYVSVASPSYGSTRTLSGVLWLSLTKTPHSTEASGSHQKASDHTAQRSPSPPPPPPPFV